MRTAVNYLGKVGVGVTAPEFFRADDDKIYVVKLWHNAVGPRVLISEIIGAAFGRKLCLPFPPSDLIKLDRFFPSGNSVIGFASQYISEAQYATGENIAQATNLSAMAGVILFDHFFHNGDRTNNRKNLLITMPTKQRKIYAIDHSHLFRTGCWDEISLTKLTGQIKLYPQYIYGVLLRQYLKPADFHPYIQAIAALTSVDIAAIIASVPSKWLNTLNLKQSLHNFILERCRHIQDIAAIILAKLPKSS